MNRSGLLIRIAVVMAFISLAAGSIFAHLFYQYTYRNELKTATRDISQLFQTISPTASIAAYVNDEELAKEVVRGLESNDSILGVSFFSEQIQIQFTPKSKQTAITFELVNPFATDVTVGTMQIYPNEHYIKTTAKKIGGVNVIALGSQAFIVTLIAIFISYFLISKPIISIGKNLHKIEPGTSNRLDIPDFHNQSEIGELVRDINVHLKRGESQLKEERDLRREIEVLEQRFRMLFENSMSPIVLMEPKGNLILVNQAFNRLLKQLDLRFKKNFGVFLEELFVDSKALLKFIENAMDNEEMAMGEFRLKNAQNDRDIWVQLLVISIFSDDGKEFFQITLNDITRRRDEMEKLSQRADYDQLTRLFNRSAAEEKLNLFIQNKVPFAVVLIDLNGFKQVNDIYGHDAGDEILKHVATVFKRFLRMDDLVCRWGGDEFVLGLRIEQSEFVKKLMDKIYNKMTQPVSIKAPDPVDVSIGASMGVAYFPKHGSHLQEVIKAADTAMYVAKGLKDTHPERYLIFAESSQVEKSDS